MGRVFQSPWFLAAVAVGGWVWPVWLAVADIRADPTPRLDHPAIGGTALAMVVFWAGASGWMLHLRPWEWFVPGGWRMVARLWWGLGWLLYLVHAAAAFHLGHGWSHEEAFRHTEAASGVGEGVFVNYLFGLVWGADAVWLAGWPDRYARRPRWVGWAVHGFLAFVTFNATVVYGTGLARWGGVVVFAVLGWMAVKRLRSATAYNRGW